MKNFPSLPPELRLQIWLLTIDPCRTVELRFVYVSVPDLSDGADFFEVIWDAPRELVYATSSTPVPAALHTCREARDVISRKYERAFTGGTEPRYVWVNFDLDIISIGKSSFTWMIPEAPRIRRLKFVREIEMDNLCEETLELQMFSKVEELIIVRHHDDPNWDELEEGFYWPCPIDGVWFIIVETNEKISWAENRRRCDEKEKHFVIQSEAIGNE